MLQSRHQFLCNSYLVRFCAFLNKVRFCTTHSCYAELYLIYSQNRSVESSVRENSNCRKEARNEKAKCKWNEDASGPGKRCVSHSILTQGPEESELET